MYICIYIFSDFTTTELSPAASPLLPHAHISLSNVPALFFSEGVGCRV